MEEVRSINLFYDYFIKKYTDKVLNSIYYFLSYVNYSEVKFMTKDVIAAIMERRTVRRFADKAIPDAIIGRLLDAARWAPSAGNLQPWHFYVVLNNQSQQQLQQACLNQPWVGRAAAAIVVCAIPSVAAEKYGQRGEQLFCLQDTAAAVENILLAATGYGLASCWIGSFNEEEVRQAVNAPLEHRPVAVVLLGYPEKESRTPAKKDLEEISTIIR